MPDTTPATNMTNPHPPTDRLPLKLAGRVTVVRSPGVPHGQLYIDGERFRWHTRDGFRVEVRGGDQPGVALTIAAQSVDVADELFTDVPRQDVGEGRLAAHARRELERLGEEADFADTLVRAVEAFASYGHSGGSAAVAIDFLHRLLRFETLTPLTSDPAEWTDQSGTTSDGRGLWQNRRDPRAFSNDGGKTWWFVDARHAGERTKDGLTLYGCDTCHGSGVMPHKDSDGR